MKRYIALMAVVALVAGCGGSGDNDNSQGPSNSRGSTSGYATNSNHDTTNVRIESVKRYNVEGVAVDIVLSKDGRIAYIASGEGGLEVIDVSSPQAPRLIYSYDLPNYINHVEIKNSVVYAAYIPKGLQSSYRVHAFDIYDPYHISYEGGYEGKSGVGHDSVVRDNYYYEVNSEGLEIFRQGGNTYNKVGSYYLHDSAYALALHKNYVFIANGRVGLTILKTDVSGVSSGRIIN